MAQQQQCSRYGYVEVTLDSTAPFIYTPGDTVSGTAKLRIIDPIATSGLFIQWKAWERVYLESGDKHKREYHHKGKTLIQSKSLLAGPEKGKFQEGTYTFPFKYVLPASAVSSTYLQYGRGEGGVYYKVKCWLEMPSKEIKMTHRFLVTGKETVEKVHEEGRKSYMFSSGELHMVVDIEKSSVNAGQTLPITVKINNGSGKDVNCLKVAVTAGDGWNQSYSDSKYEMHREEFNNTKVYALNKAEHKLDFKIPEAKGAPTVDGYCLKMDYHLDIECDVPMARDLNVQVPITILAGSDAFYEYLDSLKKKGSTYKGHLNNEYKYYTRHQ